MRILFFILDFIFFSLLTAAMISLRYGSFSFEAFLITFEALVPAYLISSIVLWIFSFYDFNLIRKRRLDYKNIIIAFTLSVLLSSFCIYFVASFLNLATPKLILLTVLLSYFLYTYISRRIYAAITITQQKLMLLGKSNTIKEISKELKHYKDFKVIGPYETTEKASNIKPTEIDAIVMGSNFLTENKDSWQFISNNYLNKGVLLVTDYNFYEHLFKRCSKGSLNNNMWLIRGVAARQHEKYYPIIKRAIDIIFCLVLMPVLLPAGVFTYLAIRFIDGIPPFFFQERIGKNEKDIFIYKFRTMKPNTEEITKVGSILRRFRLDEIPQLINIFKGDISIVGPRPVWNEEYRFLNKYLPCHNIRSIIKPGLTGWAQLNFKAPPTYCVREDLKNKENIPDSTFDAAKTHLCYDIWYIKNRSFFLDVEIMFKTAKRAFIKDKTFD